MGSIKKELGWAPLERERKKIRGLKTVRYEGGEQSSGVSHVLKFLSTMRFVPNYASEQFPVEME